MLVLLPHLVHDIAFTGFRAGTNSCIGSFRYHSLDKAHECHSNITIHCFRRQQIGSSMQNNPARIMHSQPCQLLKAADKALARTPYVHVQRRTYKTRVVEGEILLLSCFLNVKVHS